MCGRVYSTLNPNQLLRLAGTNLIRNQNRHQVSYNIGPATYVPAVRHHNSSEGNHRELDMVKWGYHAPFGQFIINARVEEAMDKKTFKPLINSSRAVMIVEGYFEWTPNKEPFVFRPKDKKDKKETPKETKKDDNDTDKKDDDDLPPVMYMACLIAPDDTLIVLTREAFRPFHEVHERMPVLLDEDEIDMWLDCEKYKFEKILYSEILNEKKEKWNNVFQYRVGPLVNSIKNKSDKLILTLEDYKKDLDKTGIKKFFQPTKKEKEPAKPEEKKEEKKEDEKAAETQPTQATQATQATLETQADKTDVERAKEEADKDKDKKEEDKSEEKEEENEEDDDDDEEEEEEKEDNPDLDHMQDMIDKSGFGKDQGGFRATKIHVMKGKGAKKSEDSGKKSKKRKDPTNKDEMQQENRKQVKKNEEEGTGTP